MLFFPFIEYCKDKKNIQFTCRCYNNKKILIKYLLEETNNYILANSKANLYSLKIINLAHSHDDSIKCTNHGKKYRFFKKTDFSIWCEDRIEEEQHG